MIISIENSQEMVNETNISNFENKLGVKLPEPFKAFLLAHNGGKPTPRKFVTVDKKVISRIMMFFPLGNNYTNNLAEIYNFFVIGKKIPNGLLPIGEDPSHSLICISVEGKSYGAVYLWDREEEIEDHQPSYKWIKLISNDFLEFINSLSE